MEAAGILLKDIEGGQEKMDNLSERITQHPSGSQTLQRGDSRTTLPDLH